MDMTPHAMTREQVEGLIIGLRARDYGEGQVKLLEDNDAALRHALAQQAQEVERLQKSYDADMKHWTEQLAAMTAERDEAIDETASLRASCHAFDLQVQELQARVRELEAVLREGSDGDAYMDVHDNLMGHYILVDELKTTLAEREARTKELEADLDTARQDAARLRELLALSKCGTCDGSGWYQDTDPMTGGPVQAQCRYCFNKSNWR